MQIILFPQKSFLKMHSKQTEDTRRSTHGNIGNRVYELGKSGLSLERLLKVTVMETHSPLVPYPVAKIQKFKQVQPPFSVFKTSSVRRKKRKLGSSVPSEGWCQ